MLLEGYVLGCGAAGAPGGIVAGGPGTGSGCDVN